MEVRKSKRVEGPQFTQIEWVTQRKFLKKDGVKFNETWSATSINVAGERIHNNFRVGYRVHLLDYMGFALGITFAP